MIDIYLHAPTKAALVTDLAPLGLAEGGEIVLSSPRHGIGHLGPVLDHPAEVDDDGNEVAPATFLPGVYAAVRCLDDALAVALFGATFPAGTSIVERPEHIPVMAGGDALDVAAVAAKKRADIRDGAEAFLAPYAAEYGAIEMASWSIQLKEAEAFQADPDANTPWLDAASASRGMDKPAFASRIISNAAAWSALQGHVNGQRLALQDQVDAILDGDGTDTTKALRILGVDVDFRMPG